MSRGDYERLPMYASSASSPRQRSSSSAPPSPTSPPAFLQPFSASYRSRNGTTTKTRSLLKPRTVYVFIKYAVPTTIILILLALYFYEPHIELAFYDRTWVQKELEPILPLSGCFDENRVSPSYNVSKYVYGPKRTEVQTGIPMRMGLDCYDFAGTIQSEPRGRKGQRVAAEDRTQFHTYWRSDLAPFGPRQEWMLKSFFATQDVTASRLTLWSNGDLTSNLILRNYQNRYPDAFALEIVDIPTLAKGTELEGSALLTRKDAKAWIDGDLIRLLLLWNFGGVWVDMDSLMTRDLEPLLEHEFVTQWDCYVSWTDKLYVPLNGALMRFRKHSPYLCEAFHVMVTSPPPRSGSTDWGATLYFKLWRRLLAASVPPFKILPFCFSDGRSCRLDNRLPDPFTPDNKAGKWTMGLGLEEGGGLDKTLHKIFGVHLHNQWEKAYPANGWVERLLLRRYDEKLKAREEL
ncbi:glycosyltransferase family 32 protein [Flammula alnicola]|nr:glycosyltransferase family 32 protein [Flammula alnicola]